MYMHYFNRYFSKLATKLCDSAPPSLSPFIGLPNCVIRLYQAYPLLLGSLMEAMLNGRCRRTLIPKAKWLPWASSTGTKWLILTIPVLPVECNELIQNIQYIAITCQTSIEVITSCSRAHFFCNAIN